MTVRKGEYMVFFGLCKGIQDMRLPNTKVLDIYEGFFADFYDKCSTETFDYDIYLELAETYGGNILELGCGSGRVTIHLLEKGLKVTGVDLSKDMLNIMKKKSANMKNKPIIVCKDMCNFVSEEKYDIVILAHATLSLLKSNEEREKLFTNVYKNLRKGGIFVFNYIDINLETIKTGEKPSKYLINQHRKSFIILTEKIFKERLESVVNLYAEEIGEDGGVNRYLSTTTKCILDQSTIADIINRTLFTKEREYVFNTTDGVIIFEVIKKCNEGGKI